MEENKCNNSIEALEEISRRLHAGHFTSQFDAMCLASVELDYQSLSHSHTSTDSSHTPASPRDKGTATDMPTDTPPSPSEIFFATPLSEVKPLRGLQGLCSEILGVLNSAVIAEQGTLRYLQQQIDHLQSCAPPSTQQGGDALNTITTRSTVGSTTHHTSSASSSIKDNEWNLLPLATDELEHSDRKGGVENVQMSPPPLRPPCAPLALLPSSQVLQARRAAPRRHLQLLYDEVFDLVVAKTRALEAVDSLLGGYEESIARLAAASGLQHTTQRAQYLSQPCLRDLLAHRFLDTTQVL